MAGGFDCANEPGRELAQIGRPITKVTTPPQAQRLIDRVLEAKVGLFDIAVLVRFARILVEGCMW